MPNTVSLLLAAALLSASGLPAPGQDEPETELVPLAERGVLLDPIMSVGERADWQAAGSDEARRAFLQAFWDRRDPTPGTQLNEAREVFLRRARRAALMFAEGSAPGFATDRGRVLLVYGLPQEIEARSEDGGPAPEIVWSYDDVEVRFQRRGDRYVADPAPVFGSQPFVDGIDEEVRLMLADAFGGSVERPEEAAEEPEGPAADDETETGAAEPPVSATAVAPEVRIWMQLVRGGVQRDDLPLRSAVRTFPAQEGTYTVLAFHLGTEGLDFDEADLEPVLPDDEGEAEDEEGEEAEEEEETEEETGEQEQSEDPDEDLDLLLEQDLLTDVPMAELKVFGAFLQGEPGNETTVHQFIIPVRLVETEVVDGESPLLSLGVTLVPGTYRLAWGVLDEGTQRAVTRDTTVEVPDYASAGLTVTDPLVARPPHRTAADEMSTQTVYRGVRLGNVLIDDDLGRSFDRDETLELVTVVTGWTPDPSRPGRPRLEVLYRILEGDEDVSIARLQPQSLDFHVLGQQIPLSQVEQLEAGKDYRILVQVTDSISGELALRQIPVSIRAADIEGDG